MNKKEYYKKWYNEHKEEKAEYQKQYRQEHKEETAEYHKQYWQKNKDERKEYQKQWRETHKDGVSAYRKQYYKTHKDEESAHRKLRYEQNKDKEKQQAKAWKETHQEQWREIERRKNFKRRSLGFIPLNEPFEGSEAHHIDKERVIYMPKEYHQSVSHNVWTGKNMALINNLAYDYLLETKIAET